MSGLLHREKLGVGGWVVVVVVVAHRIIESPQVPFLLFSSFFFFLGTCIGTWDLGLTINAIF